MEFSWTPSPAALAERPSETTHTVLLIGSWMGWDVNQALLMVPTDTPQPKWVVTVPTTSLLPPTTTTTPSEPVKITYKFIVNGVWTLDPANPSVCVDDQGNPNHWCTVVVEPPPPTSESTSLPSTPTTQAHELEQPSKKASSVVQHGNITPLASASMTPRVNDATTTTAAVAPFADNTTSPADMRKTDSGAVIETEGKMASSQAGQASLSPVIRDDDVVVEEPASLDKALPSPTKQVPRENWYRKLTSKLFKKTKKMENSANE